MITGASAYVASFVLFAVNHKTASYWSFCLPGLMLVVVGADLEFNVANMYIVSTMAPEHQSIAGAIMQTLAKLSQSIGLGAATAIFNSVQDNPRMAPYWDMLSQPYAACMFFAVGGTGLSLFLTLFITLGTQGGSNNEKTQDRMRDGKTE